MGNKYEVRFMEEDDYDKMLPWFKWWRFPAPLKEMLPYNGLGGLMVCKDGMNICGGFLYKTNSKIAWVEYIVSNPEYKSKDRTDAIKYLIHSLKKLAISYGYRVLFTSVKNESLINHLKDEGFIVGSSGTSEMVCVII